MATISTHNGSVSNRDHNIRNPKVVAKQNHIDPNGHYEIWKDEKPREAYKRLFGEALNEYNAKQIRDDRVIKDYYSHIKKDKKKHTEYEMIIGVYDSNISEATKREILKQFVDEWNDRNPNLELIGAYYHADEEGGEHAHLCYIAHHSSNTRGLSTQTGLVKALGEQGFQKIGSLTAQIQWEKRENQYLEKLCNQRGITVDHPQKEGVKHLETEIYKLKMENEQLKGENKQYKDLKLETVDKTLFGKPKETVTLKYEDYQALNHLAEQTKDLEAREKALTVREEEVRERETKANIKLNYLQHIERDISEKQKQITEILDNLETKVVQKAKELNQMAFDLLKEHNLLDKLKRKVKESELLKSLAAKNKELDESVLNGSLTVNKQLSIANDIESIEQQLYALKGQNKPNKAYNKNYNRDDLEL